MKIIACNWKMNGTNDQLSQILIELKKIKTDNRIIICPPFTGLYADFGNILYGAQNISEHKSGAYTGEISADMIAETGAEYVIVGHSERRQYFAETNEIIAQKTNRAIESGLTPIICVGEDLNEKETNQTFDVIKKCLDECLPADKNSDFIIAYEPRWAIGTGKTPTATDIESVHHFIADYLKKIGAENKPIIYGGGVNPDNATKITSISNVSGLLIGSASLKTDTLCPIILSVQN